MARAGGVGGGESWMGSTFLQGLFGGGGFDYNKPEEYQGGGFIERQRPKDVRKGMSLIEQMALGKWQEKPWQERVNFQGGGAVTGNESPVGYGTATEPLEALRQMDMGDVASDPRLGDYIEDLPKFTMGYQQKVGDIYAGARSSLGQGQVGATQTRAGQTFGESGAVSKGLADIRTGLEKGVATGRRGVVEGWQADLLSTIDRIQDEAGITFGDQERMDVLPTYGAPSGWPSGEAYQQWLDAGGDANNATMYGWQATEPGATPGYKP